MHVCCALGKGNRETDASIPPCSTSVDAFKRDRDDDNNDERLTPVSRQVVVRSIDSMFFIANGQFVCFDISSPHLVDVNAPRATGKSPFPGMSAPHLVDVNSPRMTVISPFALFCRQENGIALLLYSGGKMSVSSRINGGIRS